MRRSVSAALAARVSIRYWRRGGALVFVFMLVDTNTNHVRPSESSERGRVDRSSTRLTTKVTNDYSHRSDEQIDRRRANADGEPIQGRVPGRPRPGGADEDLRHRDEAWAPDRTGRPARIRGWQAPPARQRAA